MAPLLVLAADLEAERDHVLGPRPDEDGIWSAEEALLAAAEAEQLGAGDLLAFEALGSDATFDRVLFDGGEFGTGGAVGSDEEQDYLGLPGLLEPDQVAVVLRARQAEQVRARAPKAAEVTVVADPDRAPRGAHRTRRRLAPPERASHATIHADLRRETGGPPTAQADSVQLQQRIDLLRARAVGRR